MVSNACRPPMRALEGRAVRLSGAGSGGGGGGHMMAGAQRSAVARLVAYPPVDSWSRLRRGAGSAPPSSRARAAHGRRRSVRRGIVDRRLDPVRGSGTSARRISAAALPSWIVHGHLATTASPAHEQPSERSAAERAAGRSGASMRAAPAHPWAAATAVSGAQRAKWRGRHAGSDLAHAKGHAADAA
ncbi:MAG: hypothetical protein HS111_23725 [Kofleriaceae bacterium]|nr:hypothetical protein [Kofleriaceae bacterium]